MAGRFDAGIVGFTSYNQVVVETPIGEVDNSGVGGDHTIETGLADIGIMHVGEPSGRGPGAPPDVVG